MASQQSTASPNGASPGRAKATGPICVSPELLEAAAAESASVPKTLHTALDGLSEAEAARRLREYGPNAVAKETGFGPLLLLGKAFVNPLVLLLLVLATISVLTGDPAAAAIMGVMVLIGVGLRFVQEYRADAAAAQLRRMISVTATVVRGGEATSSDWRPATWCPPTYASCRAKICF